MDEWLMHQTHPEEVPLAIEVAFRHGYGRAFIELNKNVYAKHDAVLPYEVREAFLGLHLSVCDNKYCTIMHFGELIYLGWTLDEVTLLIESHRLPDRIEDRERWQKICSVIPIIAAEPYAAGTMFNLIRTLTSEAEADEISGVIAYSGLLRFLLECYPEAIDIEKEAMLHEMVDCADELTRYVHSFGERQRPMVTLCTICKDVKVSETEWRPVERVIHSLEPNFEFSHGCCPTCVPNWIEQGSKAESR